MLDIFGITMIRSAVAGNIELVELNLVQRQAIFAVAGLVGMLVIAAIDYRLWASISRPLFIGTVIALTALTILGAALFGSARWFDTGVILIQPSEIAKIVLILVLADYFTRNQNNIHRLSYVGRSFILAMFIVVPILLQPNLSTSIVMIVLWFAMLWASGLRLRHLLLFIAGGIFLPILAFPFLVDYQQRRILNFLFPDPNARHGAIYNIQQALRRLPGSDGELARILPRGGAPRRIHRPASRGLDPDPRRRVPALRVPPRVARNVGARPRRRAGRGHDALHVLLPGARSGSST